MLQVGVSGYSSISHPTLTILLMLERLWVTSCWWLLFVTAMGQILWANHPLLPSSIRTRQSQIYLGCQELLPQYAPGCRNCRDITSETHNPPCPLTPASFCGYWFLSLWLKFTRAVPSWIGSWVLTSAKTRTDPCWSTGWVSPRGPAVYLQRGALQTHDNFSTIL